LKKRQKDRTRCFCGLSGFGDFRLGEKFYLRREGLEWPQKRPPIISVERDAALALARCFMTSPAVGSAEDSAEVQPGCKAGIAWCGKLVNRKTFVL